jgi:hypothetical protein
MMIHRARLGIRVRSWREVYLLRFFLLGNEKYLSESGCTGFKDLQDMEHIKSLLGSMRLEREYPAQNQQVPVDELRVLVFTGYSCGMVTEGRACELLCMDRLDFRKEWFQWLEGNATMSAIVLAKSACG